MASNYPNNHNTRNRNTRSNISMNQIVSAPPNPVVTAQSEIQCSSLVVELNLSKDKAIDYPPEIHVDHLGHIHFSKADPPLKLTLAQKILFLQNSNSSEEYEDIPLEEAVIKELVKILGSKEFVLKFGVQYSHQEVLGYLQEEIFIKSPKTNQSKLMSEGSSSIASVDEDLLKEDEFVIALEVEPSTPKSKNMDVHGTSPFSAGRWAHEMEKEVEDVATPPSSPPKEVWKLWSPGDSSPSS